MGEVRPFQEEHVAETADLYLRSMRGQNRTSPDSLRNYFREIFFRNPWATEEIPSLVYLDEGEVKGFIGVIPRPLQFNRRPIRAAAVSQLFVERGTYKAPAAFEMLKHLFNGPQDLTFTDGAAEGAARVWTAVGAQVARIHSFNWIRILRPAQTANGFLQRMGGPVGWLKPIAKVSAPAIDFLAAKAVSSFRRPSSGLTIRAVKSNELAQLVGQFKGREALKPVYREREFEWLLNEAAGSANLGELRSIAVFDQENECAGTFVYYAKKGGDGYVLQIGSRRKDTFLDVLRALFQDAWEQGAASVKGQAIPQFLTTLSEEGCTFRQMNSAVLAHARDRDILNALLLGDTTISRLDGECWLHFASGDWR